MVGRQWTIICCTVMLHVKCGVLSFLCFTDLFIWIVISLFLFWYFFSILCTLPVYTRQLLFSIKFCYLHKSFIINEWKILLTSDHWQYGVLLVYSNLIGNIFDLNCFV